MESKIKFKFKKLSPMRNKKICDINSCYFVKLSDKNWYNLKDLYEIVDIGDCKNPITKELINTYDIEKIKELYNNIIEIKYENDRSNNLLTDHIEIFENQIEELYNKQEEIYAVLQQHQHFIDKLT